MPRVPLYDGPQEAQRALPTPYMGNVDVSSGLREAARGIAGIGDAMSKQQERDDQDAAFGAEATLKTDWLDFESKLRAQRKGRDAATYDAEVDAWWKDAAGKYGKDLSPSARRLITRSLMNSQVQAVAGAKTYKQQQLDASASASYDAAQAVTVNEAATIGTEDAAIKALAGMQEKRAERARLQGWTPEQTEADRLKWASDVHTVIIDKMMRADPKAAETYFAKHKGDIAATKQAEIDGKLQQVSAALDAGNAASEVWAAQGPKADGQPVQLDVMEAAVRERFKADPVRQKAAIAELRERAAAHNSAEGERLAGNVNAVMGMLSKGAGLSAIKTSPEFLALPGGKRNEIIEHVSDRNHMLWARSVEDRARMEREAQQRAYPAFLQYSDPDVLAGMTRPQVQALLPSLGPALTQHLVDRFDTLQKAPAKMEARMDAEDFNHIADSMGLAPFKADTEDKKRALGELKYRVETLIDTAQQAGKKPLSRDEKVTLMRTEMARTVTVDGGIFSRAKEVPVVQLTPAQLRDVQVPDADRAQIVAALKRKYDATKSNAYAPTEENVRRVFITQRSRAAAALVPPEPK